MHTAPLETLDASPAALHTWERRKRAAWLDYLRVTQDADAHQYEQVERNAWEQLQRRLRRNDELLVLSIDA